jgi:hypothetical protein
MQQCESEFESEQRRWDLLVLDFRNNLCDCEDPVSRLQNDERPIYCPSLYAAEPNSEPFKFPHKSSWINEGMQLEYFIDEHRDYLIVHSHYGGDILMVPSSTGECWYEIGFK